MGFGRFLLDVGRVLLDASREANENYVKQKEWEVQRNGGFESEEDYEKYERQRRIYDKRVELTYKEFNQAINKRDSLMEKKEQIFYKLENEDLSNEERDSCLSDLDYYEKEISRYQEKVLKLLPDIERYEGKDY